MHDTTSTDPATVRVDSRPRLFHHHGRIRRHRPILYHHALYRPHLLPVLCITTSTRDGPRTGLEDLPICLGCLTLIELLRPVRRPIRWPGNSSFSPVVQSTARAVVTHSWNVELIVNQSLLDRDDAHDQVSSFMQHSSTGPTVYSQISLSSTSIAMLSIVSLQPTAHEGNAPDSIN